MIDTLTPTLSLAHPPILATPLAGWQADKPAAGKSLTLSETRCFLIPKAIPGEGRPGDGKSRYDLSCLSSVAFSHLPTIFLSSDMPVCPKLFLRPPYPFLLPISFFVGTG